MGFKNHNPNKLNHGLNQINSIDVAYIDGLEHDTTHHAFTNL